MLLQYCDACGRRVDEGQAVSAGGRVYCQACAARQPPTRPVPVANAPRSSRGSSAVRLPTVTPLRRTPASGTPAGAQRELPPSGRRAVAEPAAAVSSRAKTVSWAMAGGGVLLTVIGALLLTSGSKGNVAAKPQPGEGAGTAAPPGPALKSAPAGTRPQPPALASQPAAGDNKLEAASQAEQKAAESSVRPKSVFLATDMEDIRESSAQRELDSLVELEKSGQANPFELRSRYERLVTSRGSTKAGKVAAEKLKTLPVLRVEANLAAGKPVAVSSAEGNHPGACAVDGKVSLDSAWWANPFPQWLQVDLEQEHNIAMVQLFPYWGEGRHYQYTIDVSRDGKEWRTVADQSANTKPATPDGNIYCFAPTDARYVRVNMLKNNLNPGVHIVELRVFSAQDAKPGP